jgi:hypothetical protein
VTVSDFFATILGQTLEDVFWGEAFKGLLFGNI